MKRAYKFRLYPNVEIEENLEDTLNFSRWLYNESLEERVEQHKAGNPIRCIDQLNKLPRLKFENLNIRGMVQNGRLAKSIMDASWDKLIQYTTQKVEETAGQVVLVDPRGTSQICSKCGATVKKSLSVRTHGCPNCGLLMDRDLNASLNILGRLRAGGLELLKTPMEFVPLPPQRWQV
ncbi:MAG TPA: hypothetical protein ENN25_06795 [Euryarchaeota archaeon]|nr:hypothetical protein [Euryarchaeota archaeon]